MFKHILMSLNKDPSKVKIKIKIKRYYCCSSAHNHSDDFNQQRVYFIFPCESDTNRDYLLA